MGKKGDLSDFKCNIFVSATQACLSVSWAADLVVFKTTISRVYREGSKKDLKKYPVSGSSLGEKALLILEVRDEWLDCFEMIGGQ